MFTYTTFTHPNTVVFAGYTGTVEIELVDQHPGVISKVQLWCEDGLLATATYFHNSRPPPGEVLIKTVDENEGLMQALIDSGIIEPTGSTRQVDNFTHTPVCRVVGLPV